MGNGISSDVVVNGQANGNIQIKLGKDSNGGWNSTRGSRYIGQARLCSANRKLGTMETKKSNAISTWVFYLKR